MISDLLWHGLNLNFQPYFLPFNQPKLISILKKKKTKERKGKEKKEQTMLSLLGGYSYFQHECNISTCQKSDSTFLSCPNIPLKWQQPIKKGNKLIKAVKAGDGKGIKRPEILVNFWKEQVESYSQMNMY